MLTDISFGRTSGRHHLVRLNDLHCWLADLFITSSDSTFAYRGPRRCSLRIFTGQKLDSKTIITSPSKYMHVPGVPRCHARSVVVLVKLQGLGNVQSSSRKSQPSTSENSIHLHPKMGLRSKTSTTTIPGQKYMRAGWSPRWLYLSPRPASTPVAAGDSTAIRTFVGDQAPTNVRASLRRGWRPGAGRRSR